MKFIQKSGQRDKFLALAKQIQEGNLDGLDIKPLGGNKGLFRCRKGDIRIIFEKKDGKYTIHAIGNRGDVYKGL